MLEKVISSESSVVILNIGDARFNVTLDGVVRKLIGDKFYIIDEPQTISFDGDLLTVHLANIVQMAWKPVYHEDIRFYATEASVLHRDGNLKNLEPTNLIWRFNTTYCNNFRRIPGFSRYFVDALCRVYDRYTGTYKNPHYSKRDYVTVCVVADSRPTIHRSTYLHRLIAMTYHPYGNDLIELMVNHKDGDKYNYAPHNLEFCTPTENNTHAVETDLTQTNNRITVVEVSTGKTTTYTSQGMCSRVMGIDKRLLAWRLNQPEGRVYNGYTFTRVNNRRTKKYLTTAQITLVYDKQTHEITKFESLSKAAPMIGITYVALKKRAARNALDFEKYLVKTYNPRLGEAEPTFHHTE